MLQHNNLFLAITKLSACTLEVSQILPLFLDDVVGIDSYLEEYLLWRSVYKSWETLRGAFRLRASFFPSCGSLSKT